MDYTITQLQPTEVETLVTLRKAFLKDVMHSPMSTDMERDTRAYFSAHGADGSFACFAAKKQDAVIATVMLSLYETMPRGTAPNGKVCYFYNVFTEPAERGRGIASSLLKTAIAHARNMEASAVYLTAEPAAMPLYRRHGFENLEREMRLPLD